MPKSPKSAEVLRLEQKQDKLRRVMRSVQVQLAKQRQSDRNARLQLRRELSKKKEAAKEGSEFLELMKLSANGQDREKKRKNEGYPYLHGFRRRGAGSGEFRR